MLYKADNEELIVPKALKKLRLFESACDVYSRFHIVLTNKSVQTTDIYMMDGMMQ